MSKTALIIGGTRGIGKAIALNLARENAVNTLFLNYLENDEAAEQTRTRLETEGVKVHLLKYNLAFPNEIAALFEAVESLIEPSSKSPTESLTESTELNELRIKSLDYLVHSAALTTFKPLTAIKSNQWDLTMNISARSFLQCSQKAALLMPNGGSIVAISSTGSQRYNPNYGALGVAKATLESIVRYLAVELAAQNIRVNGVVSGLIQGETLPFFPNIDEVINITLNRTPAKRLGTPEDVAEMATFILTKAAWLYGQNIILDGGYCLT